MSRGVAARVSRTAHPRLFVLVVAGVVLLAASAAAALLHAGALAFRVGVFGYLALLFGGAGYVALTLGDRLRGR